MHSNHRVLLTLLLLTPVSIGCKQIGQHSSAKLVGQQPAADPLLDLARSYERSGDLAKAIKAYEKVVSERQCTKAMHRLGVLYDQTGDFEKALANYHQALELRQSDAELWCDVGYSYYLQRDYLQSESHLRKALELNPSLDRAHNNLGVLLAELGKPNAALSAFLAATGDQQTAKENLDLTYHPRQMDSELISEPMLAKTTRKTAAVPKPSMNTAASPPASAPTVVQEPLVLKPIRHLAPIVSASKSGTEIMVTNATLKTEKASQAATSDAQRELVKQVAFESQTKHRHKDAAPKLYPSSRSGNKASDATFSKNLETPANASSPVIKHVSWHATPETEGEVGNLPKEDLNRDLANTESQDAGLEHANLLEDAEAI